jgi:hypothetical protein
VSHDPFVDSMDRCIRPWSIDGSRVVDIIAGDEQCRRVADLAHDSRGVEAQDDPRRTLRIGPRPLLDINGVHRDGADLDEEVVRSELRYRDIDVDQAVGVVGWESTVVADGGHCVGADLHRSSSLDRSDTL